MARKVIVGVIGGTVLAIGILLIVLPGPAFVVIPVGLGILATEFLWARRLLRRIKQGTASTRKDVIRFLNRLRPIRKYYKD
jgi:uncharacterized protein (TIGR02611 family)